MKLFESKKLDNSQMRALYGGARCTTNEGKTNDFVDNCGWTHYGDCSPNTEDGARVAANSNNGEITEFLSA